MAASVRGVLQSRAIYEMVSANRKQELLSEESYPYLGPVITNRSLERRQRAEVGEANSEFKVTWHR